MSETPATGTQPAHDCPICGMYGPCPACVDGLPVLNLGYTCGICGCLHVCSDCTHVQELTR